MTWGSTTRLFIVQVPGVLVSREDSWRKIDPQQDRRPESPTHLEAGRDSSVSVPKSKVQQAARQHWFLWLCAKATKNKEFFHRTLSMKSSIFLYDFPTLKHLLLVFTIFHNFLRIFLTISQMFLKEMNWTRSNTNRRMLCFMSSSWMHLCSCVWLFRFRRSDRAETNCFCCILLGGFENLSG